MGWCTSFYFCDVDIFVLLCVCWTCTDLPFLQKMSIRSNYLWLDAPSQREQYVRCMDGERPKVHIFYLFYSFCIQSKHSIAVHLTISFLMDFLFLFNSSYRFNIFKFILWLYLVWFWALPTNVTTCINLLKNYISLI